MFETTPSELRYHVMIVKYGCWLNNLPDSYITRFQDVVCKIKNNTLLKTSQSEYS